MLLNYTTTVAASKTIGEIQKKLVWAGARQIGVEYGEDGEVTAVAFTIPTAAGFNEAYLLPINVDAVQQVLREQGAPRKYQTREHAERVAWRVIKDWIEAQLAIIETEMVTFDQVMFPYMRTEDGHTIFEAYSTQRALTAG